MANFRGFIGVGGRLDGEAQLAMRSLGAEAGGEFGFLAGAAGEDEGAEGLRGREVGSGAKLSGCIAEDAALEGDGLGGECGDVERETFGTRSGVGAASAPDRPAG